MRFRDRRDAGIQLGRHLLASSMVDAETLLLGLARGGVIVALGVAETTSGELDVLVVRKLGVPWHEELAMGAVASGGIVVRNQDVIDQLAISERAFEEVVERERREVARRMIDYRGDRSAPLVADRDVILIDDGIATGATMQAALGAVRGQQPRSLVVAVPVAPRAAVQAFSGMVDGFSVVLVPDRFRAVGEWYEDFTQTTDEQVRSALAEPRDA